ncbi:uncharacterized protein LOC131940486 [Physella acuta]|uniref:uncharacterized protein LOC131940486 n=1 Tax=Physella acuta TaxID=109671 RepID=UPI0027DD7C3A|nr:uncharacterized protein LOC131940486 [Physella acuta]
MFFYIVMCWIFILEKKIADSQGVVTSIVSSDEIDEGEPFTVTCNALLASVPGDIKTITKLYIRWSEDGNEQYTYYARYRLYIPPYNLTIFSNDTSRTVTVYFSGSLRETSDSTRPENRDTMKIEILFHDAICTDEGYFYCGASYMDAEDFERSTYNKQFLYIFSIAVDPWSFYISPQSQWKYAEGNSINPAGSDVTLFCGVDGPKQLNITWKFRNTSGEISTFIPLQIDYSSSSFRWYSPSIVCHRYYYYSEIRFQTEDKYDGYTFMCLATAYNRDTSIGNMTIHTQKTIAIPAVIREGTNFSLTCEPFLAGVPKNNTKVESLKISWSDETGNTISIAEYWRNNSSYSADRMTSNTE